MRQALKLHPSSVCPEVDRIEISAARRGPRQLTLNYRLRGNLDALRIGSTSKPVHGDGLWKNTCFEAFVSASPGDLYLEFNFAPSLKWAAYRFDGYRNNMREIEELEPPHVETSSDKRDYQMEVSLDLGGLSVLPANAIWHVGLSAVIEDASGRLSYWALTHPPGKPDFHHGDCFALELPPKEQA